MDLESESVQDNEPHHHHHDAYNNTLKNNGNECEKFSSTGDFETHFSSPPNTLQFHGDNKVLTSPPPSAASGSTSPTSKGYGLKKWRRIRRDAVSRDPGDAAVVDGSKVLKRDFSASEIPTKPANSPPGGKVNLNNTDGFAEPDSSKDSVFAMGPAFVPGAESENSEDRSSKSSTAASVPKIRSDLLPDVVLGYAREKNNKPNNLSGKDAGQRGQQGKGQVESSKKLRGERARVEKENSHSSVESDSRSSNFAFMQSSFSANSNNGNPSGMSMNYDGENSDEAHANEAQFSEEVQTGYDEENAEEDRSESQQQTSCDPLIESVRNLQTMHEALKKEIEKFGEIGNESFSLNHDSVKDDHLPEGSTVVEPEIHESNHFSSSKIKQSFPSSLETQVLSLTQNVKNLEIKLEETRNVLKLKTSRVAELEATLSGQELVNELETLKLQRMEAEFQFEVLKGTIPNVIEAAITANNIALVEEQKTLAEEQTQTLNGLGETETKATMLKKQVEEMEKYCSSIVETEEVLKIQRKVYNATTRFFLQFVLLVLVVWWFVVKLSSDSGAVNYLSSSLSSCLVVRREKWSMGCVIGGSSSVARTMYDDDV
ncbi:hypothetical protein ACFE04_023416 [Oxalis oulophora]